MPMMRYFKEKKTAFPQSLLFLSMMPSPFCTIMYHCPIASFTGFLGAAHPNAPKNYKNYLRFLQLSPSFLRKSPTY